MGTPIDGVGSGGFGATRRGEMGSSLVVDKGGGQVETVLGDVDWKALLARCAWSILSAALYHASGLVSAGHLYDMVAIWF